jgi:hypothetical protein
MIAKTQEARKLKAENYPQSNLAIGYVLVSKS